MTIVYNTLKKLNDKLEGIIHSDQGFHYTHPEFEKRVKQMILDQTMSRKDNCIDNAPMDSFIGHNKDELDYKQTENFEELKQMVNQYMIYYNESRRQWSLKKMTPIGYRSHLIAA